MTDVLYLQEQPTSQEQLSSTVSIDEVAKLFDVAHEFDDSEFEHTDRKMLSLELLSPTQTFKIQLFFIAVLVAASTIGQIGRHFYGATTMHGFIPFFYLDYEMNIPTYYSSIALLFASIMLAAMTGISFKQNARYRFHWALLSATFGILAVDEVVGFHEYPIDAIRSYLGVGGMLYYAWVIPAAFCVFAFGLFFLKFLRDLPASTRYLFILSGSIFVGGAIGVEMISGIEADAAGEETLRYAAIITLEETMEMLGVALFTFAVYRELWKQVDVMFISMPNKQVLQAGAR